MRLRWGCECPHLQLLVKGYQSHNKYASLQPFSDECSSSSTGLQCSHTARKVCPFLRVTPVCHRRSSWAKNFDYGTLASLEENGETFFAVCLHCNPVLDKEHSSLNDCKLTYLLWLWYPLTSNWRCTHSHPHLRHMAFVAGRKWCWSTLGGQDAFLQRI